VEKIAGHNPEPLDYDNLPGCTYCSPEIASVGFTEEEAKEKGYDIKVGKFPFSACCLWGGNPSLNKQYYLTQIIDT